VALKVVHVGLPASPKDDPRIDLAESMTSRAREDFKGVLSAAERAAEKGRPQGSQLLLARAGVAVHSAKKSGRSAEGNSGAMNNIASVLGDMRKLEEAKKLSQGALKIYREIGDYTGEGETLITSRRTT
jgi:hypothetical protein